MPRASLLPIALLAGAFLGAMPASLAAQDSAVVVPASDSLMKPDTVATAAQDSVLRADSTAIPARAQALSTSGLKDSVDRKRPVGPGGALWRSLLLPGWGQAKLGRGITAGLFIAIEGVTLGMVLKTNSELNYAKSTDTTAVADKTQEREDWLVIMAVNHLVAGLEAYVSAHLWDFPGDLALKPVRGGGVAASVNFPVRVP